MVRPGPTGSLDHHDPEALRFLRRRVQAYGLVVGSLGLFALLIRFGFAVVFEFLDHFLELSVLPHALAACTFLGVALACRVGPLSWPYLVSVEAIGMLVGSYCYIWMGTEIPVVVTPGMVIYAVLSFGFFARVIYVPSPPRRTFILGVLIGIPLVYETWAISMAQLPQLPEFLVAIDASNALLAEGVEPTTIDVEATGQAAQVGFWWTFTVILATLASHVIYGLRRQVRDIRKLGQYNLVEKLGEGGMGIVYRAQHVMLRRPTAVKLLPPERTGERALARFEREVRLTARLTHPNTVTVFDYGRTPEGVFYCAMELLEGSTLEDVVEVAGPMPAARVVHLLKQAASALVEAHDVGLIHRDIKPANIMLTRQGGEPDVAKLVDFGLVKQLDPGASASLSQVNVIAGTPHYMSPEAITSPDDLDGRSDLYALAAVGYYLLVGETVFPGTNVVEVCSHHLHTAPSRPSERTDNPIPEALEALLLRSLAKKASERHDNAAALRDALRALDLTWTTQDAELWWSEHGEAIETARRERVGSSSGHTVVVDIQRR